MQPKLIIAFEALSEPLFLVRIESIGASLMNNASFPIPWPPQVAAPPKIAADVAAYLVLYNAAKDGDRAKIKLRHSARLNLTTELKTVAGYLELVAGANVALLATTGYELRHDIVKSVTTTPPGVLTHFKVTRGPLGGELVVHAQHDPTVDVYNVHLCTMDPLVEANWSDGGTYKHCNHVELKGLVTGKTYYVRIRGFNKNGHGVWTTSSGIPVL